MMGRRGLAPTATVLALGMATLVPTAWAGTAGDSTAGDITGNLHPGQVTTVAGTGALGSSPDGTPALDADFDDDQSIAVAPDGTLYIAGRTREQVRFVDADGLLGSVPELSGGEPVDDEPVDDESGDDEQYRHVWAVATGADGALYAVIGEGIHVRRPDGRIEALASLGEVAAKDIAVDAGGTVYAVADQEGGAVHAIDPSGAVTAIAGTDEGIVEPRSVAVNSSGAVYVTDLADEYERNASVVRRIDPDGTVSTVVGSGDPGFAGDGGPAEAAQVSGDLGGLAVGPDDRLYIADTGNGVVRAIDRDGAITTVGPVLSMMAGWPAGAPALPTVEDVAIGPDGLVYVAIGGMVQVIGPGSAAAVIGEGEARDTTSSDPWADERPGSVVTVTGPRDDMPAPAYVAVDDDGVVYVLTAREGEDPGLLRIRADGTAEAVPLVTGDRSMSARAIVPGRDGIVYLSTNLGLDVLYPDGAMAHLAGGIGGGHAFVDGAPAATVSTANWDVALGPDGLYFLDAAASAVYVVTSDGRISQAATGVEGHPWGGMTVGADGTVYVAEYTRHQVTATGPEGTSTVVAGTGESSWHNGDIGDGGPATEAVMISPSDVAVDADGTVYVSSRHGIRRIEDDGTITTVVGGGEDGRTVSSLDFDDHGNLYFTETGEGTVRVLVRPAQMTGPFPWGLAAGGVAAVAVLGVAGAALTRRRRSRAVEPVVADESRRGH